MANPPTICGGRYHSLSDALIEVKVIIGLGNPGKDYKYTRHNLGFWVIDNICKEANICLKYDKKFLAIIGKGNTDSIDTILVKPITFMNRSGICVKKLKDFFRIDSKNLIVVYDDVDIPLGEIKIKPKGGSGGHKGVESIIDSINTPFFARVRIGIGKFQSGDTAERVLSKPQDAEFKILMESVKKARQICNCWLKEGIDICMSKFNP